MRFELLIKFPFSILINQYGTSLFVSLPPGRKIHGGL